MRSPKYQKHAKPLKRQTKQARRKARGKQAAKLFTIAAILFSQADSTKRLNQLEAAEAAQLGRISKWALAAIDTMHKQQPLGSGVIKEGYRRGEMVDRAIEGRMPGEKITLEHYAAQWIAFSMLADDARTGLGGKSREWNYLAGCVATWVDMILPQVDNPDLAESLGGELGEIAWEIILR